MKTCPICHREYSDYMRYCTRDGTSLKSTVSFDTNFCSLCNKHYPLAVENCPVHGVALASNKKANNVEKNDLLNSFSDLKSSELKSSNLSPVVANILQEIMNSSGESPKLENIELKGSFSCDEIAVDRLKTNSDLNDSSLELKKAKETQNLTPPIVSESLTPVASHVSADRKLLISLALIGALSIIGFAAYSIPYALHRSKVSANTQPITLPEKNSQETAQETTPQEIAQETTPIATPEIQPTPEPNIINITPTPETLSSTENTQSSEDIPLVQTIPDLSAKSNTQDKKSKSSSEVIKTKSSEPLNIDLSKVKPTISNKSNNTISLSNKPINNPTILKPKATIITPTSKSSDWDKVTSNRGSAQISKNIPIDSNHPVTPVKVETNKSDRCNRNWDITNATTTQVKYPQRPVAKVVATITNKSRVQTQNGYVYQFELIVRELSGVAVNWDVTSVSKSSYSGRNSVVSNFLEKHLLPNGHVRYSMAIRMTGSSIEDWYGQISYNCSGVDENGNPVELHQLLALDNSFPTSQR